MGKINQDELQAMLKDGKSQAECSRHFGVSEAAVCKAVKRLKAAVMPASMEALTDKQRAFTLNLASGMNATESAMQAYDCTSREAAKVLGCRMAKEPDIATALADIMAQEGIPLRRRIKRVRDLIESADLSAASRGLDMSFKLDGAYAAEKIQVQVDHVQLKVDLNKAIEALRKEQGLEPGAKIIDIPSALATPQQTGGMK
ncbi:MAG: terminase small subunit [Deltaproteobacteria bacterium]|nr:terminase small subunit [Deltaproteobacteria bacterium]